MKKIPTIFQRDPEDMRKVLSDVVPGCEWVLAGEGVATRKYDGTCTMWDAADATWWARREVKPGKSPPANFFPLDKDETTGKTVGWEPIEQSPFFKFWKGARRLGSNPGTYELCGPKINGNPEGYVEHVLIEHRAAEPIILNETPAYDWLSEWMPTIPYEGIVWHHPDGRMAKLKRRDFPKGG